MSRRLLVVGLVAGVYVIVLGSASPADVATGLALAVAVLAVTRQLAPAGPGPGETARRALAFVPWLAVVAREVIVGAWAVVRTTLRPAGAAPAGIVAIPTGGRTEQGVAVWALAATLSPGEVVVEIDEEGGVMLLHVLDASDPDAVRERHQRIYDRYQSKVFR